MRSSLCKKNMDPKIYQFITEVQTAMIVFHCSGHYERKKIGPISDILIGLDDAFDAARNIPTDMTAHQAACEYVEFWKAPPGESDKFLKAWIARG